MKRCLRILLVFLLVFTIAYGLGAVWLLATGFRTLLFARLPYTYALGGVGAVVAVAGVVGALLPRESLGSRVTRAAEFHQPPEMVWQSLTDYEKFPTWRQYLLRVTSLPRHKGRTSWRELFVNDKPLPSWVEIEEMIVNKKLVTRVLFSPLPTTRMQPPKHAFLAGSFLTSWTYEISRTSTGAFLRVTERCVEKNPFGKFLAYILEWSGHPMTMTNYLVDLGKKFGEEVKVVE